MAPMWWQGMYSPMHEGRFSADDWGLSPAVNEAILALARAGLLRSVSLFANLPFLGHGLAELEQTKVELAAHLNFTLGRPLSEHVPALTGKNGCFRSFRSFVARGFFGRMPAAQIRLEADAQLRFLRTRCRIEAVNGHQHVHLLPWMAEPVAEAAKAFGLRRLRVMDDPAHLPSHMAALLSRARYARAWPEAELELTHYLWPTGEWSEDRLRVKVERAGERALLVHPAVSDDFRSVEFSDGLRAERVREFDSLRGLKR
jgi:predicted glycoside hydrolase/deacetylase ChbG (UPF0249 family)